MWALHIPENVRSGVDIMQVLMNGHCGESPMRLVFRVFFGAFKLWCWRRLLRFPWISGRSNQSVLKEINPEYSLEGLILSPVLWSPDKNSWLVGKGPDAGQIEEEKDSRWVDGIPDSRDMSFSKLWRQWRTGKPGVLRSMGSYRVGCDLATELQQRLLFKCGFF